MFSTTKKSSVVLNSWQLFWMRVGALPKKNNNKEKKNS
jgi:hypothetical protein